MRLPEAESAVVEIAKVRDYLLSPEHPVGAFKAGFFMRIGYSREDWTRLTEDIRRIAIAEEAFPTGSSGFGQKYEVRGTLVAPTGIGVRIVTIWIVLRGENTPRFVTAYPE